MKIRAADAVTAAWRAVVVVIDRKASVVGLCDGVEFYVRLGVESDDPFGRIDQKPSQSKGAPA